MADREREARLRRKRKQREKQRAARKRATPRRKSKKHSVAQTSPNQDHDVAPVFLIDGAHRQKHCLRLWHIHQGVRRVGTARLTATDGGTPSVFVQVSEAYRGRGLGTQAFQLSCELSEYDVVEAEVRHENVASIRALASAGFTPKGKNRSGELRFEWRRKSSKRRILGAGSDLSDPEWEELFAAFPDHDISLEDTWTEIRLRREHGKNQDHQIPEIAKRLFDISHDQVASFYRVSRESGRTYALSLVDSWAPMALAWHLWCDGEAITSAVHLDDHSDLMPCPIEGGETGKAQTYALTQVLAAKPSTWKDSILRGAFHKGSFLTAVMCTLPIAEIHWVKPSDRSQETARIKLETTTITLPRLGEVVVTTPKKSAGGATLLQRSHKVPTRLPEGGVWLHIDLDGFCNRYDGDSDRRSLVGTPEEKAIALERAEVFVRQVEESDWFSKLRAVSVGLSPGFCPAELWEPLLEQLGRRFPILLKLLRG